jgi:hypothetical protein
LPKYTQLQASITIEATALSTDIVETTALASHVFALTDVATVAFLQELYNIPAGIKVRYGSNQSVVEFYEEVFRI